MISVKFQISPLGGVDRLSTSDLEATLILGQKKISVIKV